MADYVFSRYEVLDKATLTIPDDEIVAEVTETAGKIIVITYKVAP